MSEQNLIQEKFLETYDAHVDDIYAYCLSETHHKDMAHYLTQAVFKEAWDHVSYTGENDAISIEKLVNRIAREQVSEFESSKKSQSSYYDKLWNLTLSQ